MNKIIKPRIRLENETEENYKTYLKNFYFETNLPHPYTRYEFAKVKNLKDTEEVMDGDNGEYSKYLKDYYKDYFRAQETQVNLAFNMGMLYTSNSFEEIIVNEKEAKPSLIERFKQKQAERKARKEEDKEDKEEEEIIEEKEAKPSLIERFKQKRAERKTRKEKEDDNDEDFKFELAEEEEEDKEDKEEEEIIEEKEEKEKKPSLIERLKQKRAEGKTNKTSIKEMFKENKALKILSTIGLFAGVLSTCAGVALGLSKLVSPLLAWTAGIVGAVGIGISLFGLSKAVEDEYYDEEEFEEETKKTKKENKNNKKNRKKLIKSKEKEDSDFEFDLNPEEDEEDKEFEFNLDPKEEEDKDFEFDLDPKEEDKEFEFDLDPKEEPIKSELDAKKEAAIRQIIREEIENTALVVRPEKQLPRVLKK